jgi:hypothetical protein
MNRAKVHPIALVAILATALLAASPVPATVAKRATTAEPAVGCTENASGMELKIRSAQVGNDGTLRVDFSLTDGDGAAIKGLTRQDIARVSFGRLGYEDEVGLRNVVGQPGKVWLSYFEKSREGGVAGGRAVAGLGDKERLTEHGGGYTLQVSNPARLLTRFSYSPAAETGVALWVKRGDGARVGDAYYWMPAVGKRIAEAEIIARQEGGKAGQSHAAGMEIAKQVGLP